MKLILCKAFLFCNRDATIVASLEWMRGGSGIRMMKGGIEKRHAFFSFLRGLHTDTANDPTLSKAQGSAPNDTIPYSLIALNGCR